jgi:hypothetical protein
MSTLLLSFALAGQITIPAESPRFDEIKVGESIVRWQGAFEVHHVIDDNTMVVTYYYRPHIKLWVLKGWSTKNVVDGDRLHIKELTKVDGTERWAGDTLRVISPLNDRKENAEVAGGEDSVVKLNAKLPAKWVNTSYDTTIYRLEDGRWAEKENKTNKVKWYFKELARTAESVELLNLTRDQVYRMSAKRLELQEEKEWAWLSNGHWVTE